MQYRTMPGSDEPLSVLGYGCMRFPTHIGGEASTMIDKERTIAQIRGAIDAGINYLDTAYFYHMGASETFLGEHILKDGYREKVKLATKLPCMLIKKKEELRDYFNKQLKKLQTDYFDYYLLHALNGDSWDLMKSLGVIEFMEEVKASGQVKHMGFSFHGKKQDFMRICDEYDFEFAQVQYNLLDVRFQAGIEGIEYAHNKGMGVIVMEPLRGGSLVGKMPYEVKKIYEQAKVKRSPAEWALKFVWNHPAVQVVLSGMNEEAHIEENIRVASETLPNSMTEEDLRVLDEVKKAYDNLMQVGCTGCAYCLPCPAMIDIPAAFKNLNNAHMFSKNKAKLEHMLHLGIRTEDGKARFTNVCINCGKCERKCPQNIPVREVFKQVQKELETPSVKVVSAVGRLFMKNSK